MISSVIAKFAIPSKRIENTILEINGHPQLEIGDLVDGSVLPITIDAGSQDETESITQWILSREAVEFVDVVFVHFEHECLADSEVSGHDSGTNFDDEK